MSQEHRAALAVLDVHPFQDVPKVPVVQPVQEHLRDHVEVKKIYQEFHWGQVIQGFLGFQHYRAHHLAQEDLEDRQGTGYIPLRGEDQLIDQRFLDFLVDQDDL